MELTLNTNRRLGTRRGGGCLVLFALPFAAVGLGALLWACFTLLEWQHIGQWVPVEAKVLATDLEQHTGDDSTTYRATATYEYRYDGRGYVGTRVAISGGSDNIGDFQQRTYDALRAAQARGATIIVYVDPSEPSESIVNRDLRWSMLLFQLVFGLIFGGVGFGLMIGARFGSKKLAIEEKLKARYPNEPWRWREAWQSTRLRSSTRATAYVAIGFAVLWNLISSPVLFIIPDELGKRNYGALVALLFPLVGAGLAIWSARAWLRHRRFKEATLILQRLPVPLGGRLKGTIRVAAEVPVDREFRLELACVTRQRSGTKNETSERLLWQLEQRLPKTRCMISSSWTTIPIDLAVPADQPPTSTTDDDVGAISWRLDVSGECPGPDFWARFDLPVFDTGEQPVAEAAASDVSAEASAAEQPGAAQFAALGIRSEKLPRGGEAWTFRRGRHAGVAFMLTLFCLVFGGMAAFLLTTDAPIIMAIAFAGFDTIFVWWALSLWFTEYRVKLDDRVLTLERRGFMARSPIEIPRQWVRNVRAKRGMQAGNKLYYDLQVDTPDGTYTAASSISDYKVASWFVHRLKGSAPRPA